MLCYGQESSWFMQGRDEGRGEVEVSHGDEAALF